MDRVAEDAGRFSADGGQFAVLGDASGPYVRDLLRAAEDLGIRLRCLAFQELSARMDFLDSELGVRTAVSRVGMETACMSGEESRRAFPALGNRIEASTNLSGFDAVLVRSMPLGSLEQVIFRMDCLQVAMDCGTPVVNPPKALEVSIDKWLTLHRLSMAGLPVPRTVACQDRELAMESFERLGGDVVVKPLFGGEGRGLIRVNDKDMAWRVFGTLHQLRSVSYIQEYWQHFGYDIRVLWIGNQPFVVRRLADSGNWRTNVAQGSRAEPHAILEADLELARRAAFAVAGESYCQSVLGIDLLPCKDGQTRILEVNAVPGWRALSHALDVDIARKILVFVDGLRRR